MGRRRETITTDDERRAAWETYSRAWSSVERNERSALLEASLHRKARYADPNTHCEGREEIASYMAETQMRMRGVIFRNDSVAQHHGTLLAHWSMIGADGRVIASGVSFARFDGACLIEMTGFFPTPPIAA